MLPLLVAGRAKLMIISLKEGTRGECQPRWSCVASSNGVESRSMLMAQNHLYVYVVRGPRWYVAVKIALIWRIYAV